jgi:aryl-alcohol dehydrogenase-like predicted oxidoreductase
MRYRPLGASGIEVSELGYGTWGISRQHWIGADDEISKAALNAAIDAGVNFIDTALVYGDGHSERLVGEVVRARSEPVYVATKIPAENGRWPAEPGDDPLEMFSARWMTEATERSLRNLGVERIDVQQLHTWTDDWLVRGDWASAVANLKKQGKIDLFGVSIRNHDPGSVLELVRSGLVDTVQVIYNVFDQSPEDTLLGIAADHGVGIVVRVPFDEGGLTGRIRPHTTFPLGDFRNDYFGGDRKRQTYERVNAILADVDIGEDEIASVALRFCLSHPAVSTVIPGMRTLANVARNVAAVAEPALDEAVLLRLRGHRWDLPA